MGLFEVYVLMTCAFSKKKWRNLPLCWMKTDIMGVAFENCQNLFQSLTKLNHIYVDLRWVNMAVPWQEGYWKMGDFQIILQTSGDNKLLWKNMVFLDYPDIPVECVNLDCEFGSFGQPRSGTNCRFFCWLFGKKILFFVPSSNTLISFSEPWKSFLSWQSPQHRLLHYFQNFRDTRTPLGVSRKARRSQDTP